MRTPGVPVFRQKKKKKTVLVRVGSGTGRDKTKPKRRRFRVKSQTLFIFSTLLSHSFSFSATRFSLLCSRFSLFSAFDSLCLSLPHSTAGALGSLFLTSSLYRRRATERKGIVDEDLRLAATEDFPHCGSDCGIF
jgi:hypothetical protein